MTRYKVKEKKKQLLFTHGFSHTYTHTYVITTTKKGDKFNVLFFLFFLLTSHPLPNLNRLLPIDVVDLNFNCF